MGLGSFILYLRALKEGITPREVAAELEMPEHYIHAIELEKHAGNAISRGKLADYFNVPVDDFNDYSRSTHQRFMELLKKERRPQVGFLLMSGETLLGTVDGADTSIVKIVEMNTGTKTILQRHSIKKWWPLKARAGDGGDPRSGRDNRGPIRRPGVGNTGRGNSMRSGGRSGPGGRPNRPHPFLDGYSNRNRSSERGNENSGNSSNEQDRFNSGNQRDQNISPRRPPQF